MMSGKTTGWVFVGLFCFQRMLVYGHQCRIR